MLGNVVYVASGRVGPLQLSQLEMSVKEHRADSEQRMVRVDAQLNKAQLGQVRPTRVTQLISGLCYSCCREDVKKLHSELPESRRELATKRRELEKQSNEHDSLLTQYQVPKTQPSAILEKPSRSHLLAGQRIAAAHAS